MRKRCSISIIYPSSASPALWAQDQSIPKGKELRYLGLEQCQFHKMEFCNSQRSISYALVVANTFHQGNKPFRKDADFPVGHMTCDDEQRLTFLAERRAGR